MSAPARTCTSRSDLLSLLSEACELEHGLLCSYLFTAFTLKQDLSEGGFTWQQQQQMRLWAAQIYAVASEEMLHLAQVWNLLAAIGGTPYYYRPAFPVSSRYYRLHLPLSLQPFGSDALKRFMMYELPTHMNPEEKARDLGLAAGTVTLPGLTVGQLYELVRSGFHAIPAKQLFVGDHLRQVGADFIDFPGIVRVKDPKTADQAIAMIMEQGEGTTADHDNCHFGMFRKVLRDYDAEKQRCTDAREAFEPVRRVAENPLPRERGGRMPKGSTLIEHPYTQVVSEYFDELYELTMRMLQFVFSSCTDCGPESQRFAKTAIVIMTTVIKPLGEALTLLPMREMGADCAGPSFGMSRHVALSVDPGIATLVVRERLEELCEKGKLLRDDPLAPSQLVNAISTLERYAAPSTV